MRENWKYYEETENIFPLEMALDQISYAKIWAYLKLKMSETDKKAVKK
ncbi:MAG: hypothetical protein ACTSYM_03880 [Candidatus Baldrarchaeia archaeon]